MSIHPVDAYLAKIPQPHRKTMAALRTGDFRDGAQAGLWVTWDKNGRKVKETRF